jgi:predicted acyl esterase
VDYALRGVAPTALRSISCDAFAAGAKTPRRQAPAANATPTPVHCSSSTGELPQRQTANPPVTVPAACPFVVQDTRRRRREASCGGWSWVCSCWGARAGALGGASHYVQRGYARLWADVVGTGNSSGCFDYGGIREQQSGYDVVEWIARQSWSTGKVGMIGGSYNGTTATATAITRPPHLTTIVPEAAISRWYEYAFSGGVRYFDNNEDPSNEGVDTPLAFDFGLALPPPVDATDPSWADRVASTIRPCDELEHTQYGYDDTPDYDAFWFERDYVNRAGSIRIPVLVAYNWGDWNVKQEESINLYRALTNSPNRKLYAGTRWHSHGTPGGNYGKTVDAWFDHYLRGKANGIQDTPAVHSEMSDYSAPIDWYAGAWPPTKGVTLYSQYKSGGDYQWRLLPNAPKASSGAPQATFSPTGTNTESSANQNPRRQRVALVREPAARARRAHLRRGEGPAADEGRPDVDHVHADGRRHRPDAARRRPGCAPGAGRPRPLVGDARVARHALPGLAVLAVTPRSRRPVHGHNRREAAGLHLPQGPPDRPHGADRDERLVDPEALPGLPDTRVHDGARPVGGGRHRADPAGGQRAAGPGVALRGGLSPDATSPRPRLHCRSRARSSGDRALPCGGRGRKFDSCRAHTGKPPPSRGFLSFRGLGPPLRRGPFLAQTSPSRAINWSS